MAYIELPKLYHPDFATPGRKPVGPVEVDYSSSISKKLRQLVYAHRSNDIDLIGGVSYTPTSTKLRDGWICNGSSSYIDYDNVDFTNLHTFFAYVQFDSGTGGRVLDANGSNRVILERNSSNGKLRLYHGTWNESSLVVPTGKPVLVGWKTVSGDGTHVFVDSQVEWVVDTQRVFAPTACAIFAHNAGTVNFCAGKIFYAGIANGELSDAEIASISRDPYQILRPSIPMMFFTSAGGATYSLTAESGGFSLTGNASGLTASRKLLAEQGSFVLTGANAGLAYGRTVIADTGAFTLTGNATGLAANKKLAADQGSFILTGADATLTYNPASSTYSMSAGTGAFVLTGANAGLAVSRKISADQGSFTLTGGNTGLARWFTLTASQGSIALTGGAMTFGRTYAISAEAGSYVLTGGSATLSYSADEESFTITTEGIDVRTLVWRAAGPPQDEETYRFRSRTFKQSPESPGSFASQTNYTRR